MPDIILATKSQLDAHKGDNVSHHTTVTSSTAASTTVKTVAVTGYVLATNSRITVKFANANTASAPTLNVNSTGAKRIYINGEASNGTTNTWSAGDIIEFIYDGTYWQGFSAKLAKEYGNNVKANTVSALLSVDDSLPITSSTVWTDVITQIGNISTGKAWITGTITDLTSGYMTRTISSLPFKPMSAIFFTNFGSTDGILILATRDQLVTSEANGTNINSRGYYTNSSYSPMKGGSAAMTDNSVTFTIPTYAGITRGSYLILG